jgi:hypothetical protein
LAKEEAASWRLVLEPTAELVEEYSGGEEWKEGGEKGKKRKGTAGF